MIHLKKTSIHTICVVCGCIFLLLQCIFSLQHGKMFGFMSYYKDDELIKLFGQHDLCSFHSLESFRTVSYDGPVEYPASPLSGSNGKIDCAYWIPQPQRKVLFVELYTWKKYYGPSKYKTGEYYVSSTWDYALRENGFVVDRVSERKYYERMTKEEIMKYHLVLVRDPRSHRFYDDRSLMCKVRPMYFFGDWFYGKNNHNYRFQVAFGEKQILTPYPEKNGRNTFLGYFPHDMLLLNKRGYPYYPENRRRVGLLYGKDPRYFEGYERVIQELLKEGFELHTTCKDSNETVCPFPVEVIRHGTMLPDEFATLMKQFSFVLGFKKPPGSPTPLVGISNGVTFLNPLREEKGKVAQHKALSKIGFPYSYVVDLGNVTDVVGAAEMAHTFRFPSYVPPSFRPYSLVDRMCSLLEDSSPCSIP